MSALRQDTQQALEALEGTLKSCDDICGDLERAISGTGLLAARVRELESQAALDAIVKWQEEGERLVAAGGLGVLFRLGAWWADRPWRAR